MTGIDYYHSAYGSDRGQDLGAAPNHHYDITQDTAAVYANGTLSVRPDTDITFGGALQHDKISAHATPTMPRAPGAYGAQGMPFDRSEGPWAAHLGIEHRFNAMVAVFGHVAQLPRAQCRRAHRARRRHQLRSEPQVSREIEGGVRLHVGRFKLQTSVYHMDLTDEIFYSPATFTNVNLDPTRHYGVETTASLRVTRYGSLHGNVAYTRAMFREGMFAGNDIPLISRWTGNAGLTWDIWRKWLVYDLTLHYAGSAGSTTTAQYAAADPGAHVVDMRIGGQFRVPDQVKNGFSKNTFWSFAVQNVFNDMYYDYGIASTTRSAATTPIRSRAAPSCSGPGSIWSRGGRAGHRPR